MEHIEFLVAMMFVITSTTNVVFSVVSAQSWRRASDRIDQLDDLDNKRAARLRGRESEISERIIGLERDARTRDRVWREQERQWIAQQKAWERAVQLWGDADEHDGDQTIQDVYRRVLANIKLLHVLEDETSDGD